MGKLVYFFIIGMFFAENCKKAIMLKLIHLSSTTIKLNQDEMLGKSNALGVMHIKRSQCSFLANLFNLQITQIHIHHQTYSGRNRFVLNS